MAQQTLVYPTFAKFPPVVNMQPGIDVVAADTGDTYQIMNGAWVRTTVPFAETAQSLVGGHNAI